MKMQGAKLKGLSDSGHMLASCRNVFTDRKTEAMKTWFPFFRLKSKYRDKGKLYENTGRKTKGAK